MVSVSVSVSVLVYRLLPGIGRSLMIVYKMLFWSLTLVNYELGSGKLLLSSVTMTLNAESLFKTLFPFSNYPALLSLVISENDNLQPIRH